MFFLISRWSHIGQKSDRTGARVHDNLLHLCFRSFCFSSILKTEVNACSYGRVFKRICDVLLSNKFEVLFNEEKRFQLKSEEMLTSLLHCSTILYFISIINVKDGNADIALRYLNPKIYENLPKIWHHYVRMTIVSFVERTQYSYSNIQNFRKRMFQWSKLVLHLSFRRIKMYSNSDKKRKTITFVTGQFILQSDKTYNGYFRYNINSRLRLNITFVIMFFTADSNNSTTLRIKRDGKKHVLFAFYGHHSPFNFYPNFNKVLMKFIAFDDDAIYIKFYFYSNGSVHCA